MVEEPPKTLQELAGHVGQYPEEAFLFIREGLSFASERVHGRETSAHRHLQQYLLLYDLDWSDLIVKYHANELPGPLAAAIDAAGGCEKLNRHVNGRELCWALRDYALERWGMLAKTVLEGWNIKRTNDFGRIVFGFIDFDMMRKQPEDSPEDFDDIYNFNEAFDQTPDDDLCQGRDA